MAVDLHGSARTTPQVRADLQASKESTSVLARCYGLSRATVNKWRSRSETCDAPMGLIKACSRHDEYIWFFRPRLADCCAIPSFDRLHLRRPQIRQAHASAATGVL
jgi:hypothetical protein